MNRDKNSRALVPPMGWNSWDCYGAAVTEKEVRANADYMAAHLKVYGWEYIVVDIQWYEPTADSSWYHDLAPLEMDMYGRLIPAVNRFPSARDGRGFKPLADYVHSKGLKFGIHIMRGIPRQAVYADTPVLGTNVTARQIANGRSVCQWNTDMYGVDITKPGAQEYYNSLFALYAEWGVDYVKVDDLSAPNYAEGEIEAIHKAIEDSGRDMVFSTSPGPTPLKAAEHLKQYVNLWRVSNDYWDRWQDLYKQFEFLAGWSTHIGLGHWLDADMLPLGHIGIRSREHGMGDRWTLFTKDEQLAMMSLWCICRSPLMFGGELNDNDDWTLDLLTNSEVLDVLKKSHGNKQLYRREELVAWTAKDEAGNVFLAHFNLREESAEVRTGLEELGLTGTYTVRDLWNHEDIDQAEEAIVTQVPSHGVKFMKLGQVKKPLKKEKHIILHQENS